MKVLSIILLVLFLASVCFAEWADIPLKDIIKESDLIVVGTLDEVKEHTKNGIDYGQGVIVVHKVLRGIVQKDKEKVTLIWSNPTGLACPRVEQRYNQNKKGIWMLSLQKDGKVRADYPKRYQSIEKESEILKLLQQVELTKK